MLEQSNEPIEDENFPENDSIYEIPMDEEEVLSSNKVKNQTPVLE